MNMKKKQNGDKPEKKDIKPLNAPHEMDSLAAEGSKLLTAADEIPPAPVKVVAPVTELNPYIRAKNWLISRMSVNDTHRITRINNDKKANIILNPADEREFQEFSRKINLIGNDLSDGLPLPKK